MGVPRYERLAKAREKARREKNTYKRRALAAEARVAELEVTIEAVQKELERKV